MNVKKVILLIVFIVALLVLNSTNIFAIKAVEVEVYNNTSLIISFIIKSIIFIVFISYVVFFIVYMIRAKKEKSEKIKKLIKWLIITLIIILVLWFASEEIKEIGKTIECQSNQTLFLLN